MVKVRALSSEPSAQLLGSASPSKMRPDLRKRLAERFARLSAAPRKTSQDSPEGVPSLIWGRPLT